MSDTGLEYIKHEDGQLYVEEVPSKFCLNLVGDLSTTPVLGGILIGKAFSGTVDSYCKSELSSVAAPDFVPAWLIPHSDKWKPPKQPNPPAAAGNTKANAKASNKTPASSPEVVAEAADAATTDTGAQEKR